MASTPAPGRSSGTGRSSSAASGKERPRRRRWLWWLAVPAVLLGLALASFLLVMMVQVPLPEDIAPGATTVLDRDGQVVGTLTGETTRQDVEFAQVPETTRLAVLAAEDRAFYTHGGIAPLGIMRAAVTNLRAGEVEQGGSTITQQYVKNAVVGSERTYLRKMREAALAIKLDREYPKDTILEWYLDTIYWGRGAYGIGAAASTYFDVSVQDLTLNQSATLAGMISSPENLDPAENPDGADQRRRYVLEGMLGEGWITQAEHDQAVAEGLPQVTQNTALSTTTAPYYLDAVRRELSDELGDRAVAGNLKVYTGLDVRAQQEAERIVRETLANSGLEADLTGAVVTVDPATGEVRTLVGGPDFAEQSFNAAVRGRRQVGSTFKAFTLTAWLEAGLSPESRLEAPAAIQIGDTEFNDYAGQDRGTITVFDAMAQSANTVFVQMQQQIGADPIVDVATRLGLPEEVGGEDAFSRTAGMTLGQDAFTPLEMAEAFNTFAAEGVHTNAHTIVRVEDADGNVVYEADRGDEGVVSANDARTATEAMRRVITQGTGGAADIGRPAAGKTGTTSAGADGWFAGYTPQLTGVAWVGRLEGNEGVEGLSGGNVPATLWQQVMATSLEGVEATDFTPPDLSQYEVLNEAPEPCPEGYTEAGEVQQPEGQTAPPDGGPEGSGQPAPAETRTEIAPGTEDREGGPCIRIVVEQPSPSPTETTESETETETETETELPTETETSLLPTEEETTEEPSPEPSPTEEQTSEQPTENSTRDTTSNQDPEPTETSTSEAA